MNLYSARAADADRPFRAACKDALSRPIEPEYDYILVDEAQDFPPEFFKMLYKLATPPNRRICWAYDELQSLTDAEMPGTVELFGVDENGKPLVDLTGDDYPGEIEKDLVLKRSYRCPEQILMLAHAIGLGIHSKSGCVQMLQNRDSWKALGYEVEGNFVVGQDLKVHRPKENSSNNIPAIYTGKQALVTVSSFADRGEECKAVAASVAADIKNEKVEPHQIVVVSLDSLRAKAYLRLC